MTLDQTTAADLGRITSDLNLLIARLTGRLEGTGEALEMAEETITELNVDLEGRIKEIGRVGAALREVSEDHRHLKEAHRILEREKGVVDGQLEKTQAARDEYTVGIPSFMRTVRGYTQTVDGEVFAVRWGDRIYYAHGPRLLTRLAPYGSVAHANFVVGDLAPFELVPRPRGSYGFGFKKL